MHYTRHTKSPLEKMIIHVANLIFFRRIHNYFANFFLSTLLIFNYLRIDTKVKNTAEQQWNMSVTTRGRSHSVGITRFTLSTSRGNSQTKPASIKPLQKTV